MRHIREYLFVDTRRLETYFDQIAEGAMLRVEKASAWKLSAGLTSLGVNGSDSVHFRDQTVLEKLSLVEGEIERRYLQSSAGRRKQRSSLGPLFERVSFWA